MKKSEVIMKHRQDIAEQMVREYKGNINYPNIVTDIYIWQDGEIQTLDRSSSDSTYLKPKAMEERALYFVCTVAAQDWGDQCAAPQDGQTWDDVEQITKAWLISEYMDIVDDTIDSIITQAIQEEEDDRKTWND